MAVSPPTLAAIRFGYGLTPGATPAQDAAAVLAQARDGGALIFPVLGLADRAVRLREMQMARRADKMAPAVIEEQRSLNRHFRDDALARILQRALSPHGFFERLAAFWADHFTISAGNNGVRFLVPAFEVEAIRPHVAGLFADMLVAATRHPLMLRYLDQIQSFGPTSPAGLKSNRGLNENLAREVLELHTLGVGGPYTQGDVREFAELLTGWNVAMPQTVFDFQPGRAEPGAETVLGRAYGGGAPSAADAEAALRDLAAHPATAAHLARKLAVHLIADDPDPDLVAAMAAAWGDGGDLMAVYGAMLDHPAAWAGFGAKVKQPLDLVASTIRAAGYDPRGVDPRTARSAARIFGELNDLNQPHFAPPGPDGWPERAEDWLTPQGLAARLAFAAAAGQFLAQRADLDPRAFARTALGDALRPDTEFVVGAAPDRWEGIALTLASPEFNRR